MRISLASSLKHQTPEMNTMGIRHTYYRCERRFRICDVVQLQGHTGTQKHTHSVQFRTHLTLILTARLAKMTILKSRQASRAGTSVCARTLALGATYYLMALQFSNKGSRKKQKLTFLKSG